MIRNISWLAIPFVCLTLAMLHGNQSDPTPQTSDLAIQRNIPSLCDTLAKYFPVGTAIWAGDITGPHSELLKKHFNSITAENAMKWQQVEPIEGHFAFAVADALVAFAKANHMRVRGHTLVWHEQNPPWLFEDAKGEPLQPTPANKALMLDRLRNHIRVEVSHFGNAVYAWDVVNEVIDPKESDGFRRSPWFLLTGSDYIEVAFRTAHEVAPHAKLYINDFDTTDPRKRAFLLALVRNLKEKGVPIDGIGHQMHINLVWPSTKEIAQTIRMFSALGVGNQITELDVSLYPNHEEQFSEAPESLLVKQGYRYKQLFQTFRRLHHQISAVTFWGYADDHTWLARYRLDWPLLFDAKLQAKAAFWGIVNPRRLAT